MIHTLRSSAGFTLIEGMIASMILTIGLLGLIAMQTFAFTRNVDAKELTMASNLVSEMVERIEFNRQHVTAYQNIDTLNSATQPSQVESQARGDYAQWQTLLTGSGLSTAKGTVTVALQDADPAVSTTSLGRRLVTVQVTWSGPNQQGIVRSHTVTMNTIVSPD